jgi:hypothetical protein
MQQSRQQTLGGTVIFTTSAGASDAATRLIKRIGARA